MKLRILESYSSRGNLVSLIITYITEVSRGFTSHIYITHEDNRIETTFTASNSM